MRPINEVIKPNLIDQRGAYETQFTGMTRIAFNYDDHQAARDRLIEEIHGKLTDNDRRFLISFKQGDPDWPFFPVERVRDLPAVQWKLQNIRNLIKTNPKKHKAAVKALEDKLF